MKKSLVWVVLLGAVLTMNSCGNDDPDPIPPIVGTWNLAKYKFTDLPTGFTKYEGYETVQVLGIEVGYTFVFKDDGKYTRAYNVGGGYPSVNDKGTWTQEDALVKVSPDNPDDLDKIDFYGTVGTEFTVVGDITDIRMTISKTATVFILPDSFDRTKEPTDDDFKEVDITLQYVFNRL
jgi:hypothetical protein